MLPASPGKALAPSLCYLRHLRGARDTYGARTSHHPPPPNTHVLTTTPLRNCTTSDGALQPLTLPAAARRRRRAKMTADKSAFHTALFSMLLRYKTLSGGGYQVANRSRSCLLLLA